MVIPRHLRDLYGFPGFVASAQLQTGMDDPQAVVIILRRRRKKRSAAPVAKAMLGSTIKGHDEFAISPAEIVASTSRFRCAESIAGAAAA